MIDLNHQTKPTDEINKLIDVGILKEPRSKRTYLGASMLGKECVKAIQYDYLQTEPDPGSGFSAKTFRTFAIGHALEEMAVKWFRQAGFDLRNEKYGEQFGFEAAGGRIKGHIDGCFVNGPDVIAYPALWEAKTMNKSKWNAFVKHGISKANPQYAAQVALYQAYMQLTENPAILTAINKDTSEIHHELILFNGKLAQDTSDKAVRVIQAGDQMLPGVSDDPEFFLCKWCSYKRKCHGYNSQD